ncbi:MAG: hypothetical protein J6O41_05740 [Clostridia bacterium]|nr:hypothetical protein [Clostridia bacterium]
MENNNLIPYKQNIFTKISNFFKKIFSKKKEDITNAKEDIIANSQIKENKNEMIYYNNYAQNEFIDNIVIKVDEEEKRIKELQKQYDNGEIEEEDITDEDMDKLIEMYERETEKLNADTEMRKLHISKMLKELKNT